jgi:hypothetical protein
VVPRGLLTGVAGALALATLGCGPALPEPESAGAVVLRGRCGTCHRVSAPASMTFEMWRVQVDRMRERFAQARLPWLTPDEERALLEYLERYAGRA